MKDAKRAKMKPCYGWALTDAGGQLVPGVAPRSVTVYPFPPTFDLHSELQLLDGQQWTCVRIVPVTKARKQ
jgi:hypothetical protein